MKHQIPSPSLGQRVSGRTVPLAFPGAFDLIEALP